MKTLYAFLGGLTAAAIVVTGFELTRSADHRTHAETSPDRNQPTAGAEPGASDEVARLRAEIRQKDRLLASLIASQSARGANPADSPAPQPPPASPEDRAAELLDERMSTGPRDTAKQSEMEQAVRSLSTSQLMGKAKVASLSCGPRLCKVSLTADDQRALNESMADLGAQLPKLFGATAVHRLSDGETVMYLGRSGEDLALPRNAD